MYFTNKQVFYVNSKLRNTGTNSQFSYYFKIDPNAEFDRVVMLQCSIPKSFYLIPTGANQFVLQEGTNSVTINFPIGNYTRASLAAVLKAQLTANSPNGYTYNVTYPNTLTSGDLGFFTFTVSGNGATQPSLIFTNSMFEQLGFNSGSTNTFNTNTLSSTNVCNLSTETTLFIHSDMCQNSEGDDVLQEIYSSGDASFSYINYRNMTPKEYSKNLSLGTSNLFNFNLTDEYGTNIDLNGVNMNFTIMIYKQNKIDNLFKGFMKYITMKLG